MGPLFYHTSHVPGLLFWLRANVIANIVCVRVADHELAAGNLLEPLTDYQVTSSRLAILVIRILTALLALVAAPVYHCVVIDRLVHCVHPIPTTSRVDMLLAPLVRLAINGNRHALFGDAPTLNRSARNHAMIKPRGSIGACHHRRHLKWPGPCSASAAPPDPQPSS